MIACTHTLTAGKPPPDTHIEACSKNAVRHKQNQKPSKRCPTERRENEQDKKGGGGREGGAGGEKRRREEKMR